MDRFDRVMAGIAVDGETGCWLWTGPTTRGNYGRIGTAPQESTHRVVWERMRGPIPEGMTLDHECHNLAAARGECRGGWCGHRRCCNPDHLSVKSPVENAASSPRHQGNWNVCKHGHPFTPENTRIMPKSGKRRCIVCATRIARAWDSAHAAAS